MGKVILICGKICSGKSHYAQKLSKTENAVVLSCDEIAFDLSLNEIKDSDGHDDVMSRVTSYLHKKAVQIAICGSNVILDFGAWDKKERKNLSNYYSEHGISIEWHYVDISDEDWRVNIEKRNQLVFKNRINAYYLDEGLMAKMVSLFEPPTKEEVDVWFVNVRE